MDKRIKIFVSASLFLFLIISLSYFALATGENVKSYDSELNKITISNSQDVKLAEYTLTSNSNICLINCYAEGTAILHQEGKLFSDLKFKNPIGNLININQQKILIQKEENYEVNDYSETCKEIENGTYCYNAISGNHIETRDVWEEYNGETLESGNYNWRIEGEKGKNENIDWLLSAFGSSLDEWEWWNSSYPLRRNISGMQLDIPLPINSSSYTTINLTDNIIYATGDSNTALYYNDSYTTAIANDTNEFWKVQTYPFIKVSGTKPSNLVLFMPFDDNTTTIINYAGINGTKDGNITERAGAIPTAGRYMYGITIANNSASGVNITGQQFFNSPNGTIILQFVPDYNCGNAKDNYLLVGTNDYDSMLVHETGGILEFRMGGDGYSIKSSCAGLWNSGDLVTLVLTWDTAADQYYLWKNKILWKYNDTEDRNQSTSDGLQIMHSSTYGGAPGTYYHLMIYNGKIFNSSEINATTDFLTSLNSEENRNRDITFNVTSGEDGSQISNFNINCNNSFSDSGVSSPYTAGFPIGNYECTFFKDNYYNKTVTFTANVDKTIDSVMSVKFHLTTEEHTWLEAIYNCLYLGDCSLYNLLVEVNQTVGNIWGQTKPTDESVIAFENVTNKVVDSTHNLTIDYEVNIPTKAGYSLGTYLPVRIGFWFLNLSNTTCYNQGDKPTGVEDPYCQPLIIETLGPMGGSVNFTVKLHPNLSEGDYSVKRIIDIDPNNVWINYGQESIGSFVMSESLSNYGAVIEKTGEDNPGIEKNNLETDNINNNEKSPAGITGRIIYDLLSKGNLVAITAIIGLVLITLIISRTIIKLKKK